MKEKLQRFMMGRYGVDSLNKFMIVMALVLMILSMLTGSRGSILYLLSIVLLILTYVRMLSRNHYKRANENAKYLNITRGFRGKLNKQKRYANERKFNHIYTCPSCRQKIRIPKGKGKIMVTCPKCKTQFMKKS